MSSLSGTSSGTESSEAPELDAEAKSPAADAGTAERVSPGALPGQGLRPDVLLLQKAQTGDRGAYGQIVVLYQDRLYNAVLRLVGDREEARELTQEAFTRGLEKIDSFRGDASPYTWLFRIAVNLAISQLRKVQRNRVFSLDRPGYSGNGRHGAAADDQASGLLDRVAQDRSPQPSERAENK